MAQGAEVVEMLILAEEDHDANTKVENDVRILFIPILNCISFRLYPFLSKRIRFKDGYCRSTCSVILVLILFGCILSQILMFLAYLTDMVFRPLLFIKKNSPGYNYASNSTSLTTLIFPTSKNQNSQEFEKWFLFIWDYIYGLIGLYSTIFLFIHAWNNEVEFPGIFKLINNITRNKSAIKKIQPDQPINNAFTRFVTCITCSNNQMQMFLDKIGWGLSHLCVILLSISLVVYWIVVNAIGSTLNSGSQNILSQDSDLALILAIIDCFHWHLSPVIVCFLIRISCIEITTSLDKLRFEFAYGENPVGELWSKFYSEIERIKSISMKYSRISAINISVLIFAIVGLSLRYIDKDILSIDQFIMYDWLDFIRFFTWYSVHLLSVCLMIDAMSTLNRTVDYFSDEILIILACKCKMREINEDVKTQLDICSKSKQRFSIDLFGVVTPTTLHSVIGFGSATIVIFISEALKVIIEHYIHF